MAFNKKQQRKNKTVKFKAIDLFSGCGGLTLGLTQAGFEVIGAVEADQLSFESYERNHKETYVWKQDIRTLSTLSIKRALGIRKGNLDLLAGCPPCQGFSTLVTKNGSYLVDDPRNSLIYEFLRFVEDFMPRTVLMENVPNLSGTTRFRRFCKRLGRLGYNVEYKILNAADYGVPQRRKRLVLVAGLKTNVGFARPARKKHTVRQAFRKLNKRRAISDPLHDTTSKRTEKIQRLIKKIPKDGGSRANVQDLPKLRCHANFDGFYDVYGRMKWDTSSPTVTGGCVNPSKGRFLHPGENRPITLREAALLQSFPIGYWISTKKGKYCAASLIGNAFPPEFARRQGIAIKRHLTSKGVIL